MKKIAIIGANEAINNLIISAKKKGYETHVFAWECGDIGEKSADFFYPISIDDKDAILRKCHEINPDGVATITSDFAAETANYVARNLGLICNPEITELAARNKYVMRQKLKEAELYTPNFIKVYDHNTNIDGLSFPVIVKPTDRWSSKGITRVNSYEELKDAIRTAVDESLENAAIVEEFMEGPEFSCECISINGEHHVLAFTQKFTTDFPHYIETGHNQPADIDENVRQKLIPEIKKALDALNIKNGASHTEFRLLENNTLGIVEIGARMGGGCIGTDLVKLSTGLDFVGMVADIACGNEPDFSLKTTPKAARIRFILSKEDLDIMNKFVTDHPDSIIRISHIENVTSHKVVDGNSRFGYYIYTE